MRSFTLFLVLVAVLAMCVRAEPEPDPARSLRISFPRSRATGVVKGGSHKTDAMNAESDANADLDADADEETDTDENTDVKKIATQSNKNSEPSKGRLFFNKLLLFRNPFGQQQQPVIPIIITGGAGTAPLTTGTYPTPTSPTTTTNLGTAGTSPAISGAVVSPTSPVATNAGRRDMINNQQDEPLNEAAAVVDEKELQAALAAGAQEYVVTDQEIRGTSDAKANRAPARVNLRRSGANRGETITVRIPARYRQYFKNGQKVMLNTRNRNRNRNRQVSRRGVQRRRNNRNRRRRVSGGKRRRVNNQRN